MKKFIGQVVAVYSATDPTTFVTRPVDGLTLSLEGIKGDIHGGSVTRSDSRMTYLYELDTPVRNSRQVSLVSIYEVKDIATAMGGVEVKPEWLGANILITGLPSLTQIPPAVRLRFYHPSTEGSKGIAATDDCVLESNGENLPCTGPGKIIAEHCPTVKASEFPKAAINRRGITASVEKPGKIFPGDLVELAVPPNLVQFMKKTEYFRE